MRKISKIEPAVLPAEKRKKAAVYARVSRDTRRLQQIGRASCRERV